MALASSAAIAFDSGKIAAALDRRRDAVD